MILVREIRLPVVRSLAVMVEMTLKDLLFSFETELGLARPQGPRTLSRIVHSLSILLNVHLPQERN
jgi:hypothetical protein